MKLPLLALAGAAILFCGCDRKVIVEHDHHRSSEAANDTAAPAAAPTAIQAPGVTADGQQVGIPQYYEEGATYDNTTITEPPNINDYVDINGGWYFWHPTLNIWVHSHHPREWHPPQTAHVYHNWTEHPMFNRDSRDNGRR